MHRLNLLGAVDLVGPDGRSRNNDIGGTKHLAVLVFIVIEGAERPVRRDVVAGKLWPDSEQRLARQSLSNSLHVLRTVLGDVVVSQGQEELRLNSSLIECDCWEFLELAKTGQLERGVDCYKGDFAHGLYVKESPEFEDWLSRQRDVWRAHYAAVLTRLFDACVTAGNLTAAAVWAERLLAVAPEKEEPVQTVVQLLAQQGASAAAIRLYDRYAAALLEAFGTAPPPELTQLIEELKTASAPSVRSSPLYVAAPSATRRASRHSPLILAVAVVIVMLLVARFFTFAPRNAHGSGTPAAASPPKVAVTQFGSSGSAQRAAVVLNDALQWRLQAAGFEVVNAGMQDTASIREAARVEHGSTFVVGGTVEPQSNTVLAARLWLRDAATGERIWESQFTEKTNDAHLIAAHLTEDIANQIRKAAGQTFEPAPEAASVSAEAWREVYRARERMQAASDMRMAESASGSATELAEAEAELIDAAKTTPNWGLPWVLRGRIAEDRSYTALIKGDLPAGAQELDRGIRLLDTVATGLRSADVYEMRGTLLYRRWAFGIDDVEQANRTLSRAEADLREALRLGHERSASYAALSGVMFAQGKYPEAFVYARRAYDTNVFLRNNEEIISGLFNSALHAGDDAAANQWCQELQKLQPGSWPAVMCRIHLAGFAPHLVAIQPLQDEIEHVAAPPQLRQALQPRLNSAYAVALAQVGMRDSARATLARLKGSQSDPEVLLFSAFALAALKDAPQAHAMLRKYLSQYRGTRSSALYMRWLH